MPIRTLKPDAIVTGWDFSTGAVKCLAFDLAGNVVAEVRLPTDLWTEGGVSELNLMQLEGQARASTRALAARLRELGRLQRLGRRRHLGHAPHRRPDRRRAQPGPPGDLLERPDPRRVPRRRAWPGSAGRSASRELIGGPWAVRYTLSHLVKDERVPARGRLGADARTSPATGRWPAGYLTGRFDVTSVSSAASTGIMDLRTNQWRREMLDALAKPEYRELAWKQLPQIIRHERAGRPARRVTSPWTPGCRPAQRPLVFPTLDDQAAGLVGGGAVDAGQVAVILGNSAVVNSSAATAAAVRDARRHEAELGAVPVDALLQQRGPVPRPRRRPEAGLGRRWSRPPAPSRRGATATAVLPFVLSEPSLGVTAAAVRVDPGGADRRRACASGRRWRRWPT